MKRNESTAYLDLLHPALPLDVILKNMNRRSTGPELLEVIDFAARSRHHLRTTLIAGFHGETREQFEDRTLRRSCASTVWAALPTRQRRTPWPPGWRNQIEQEVKDGQLIMQIQTGIAVFKTSRLTRPSMSSVMASARKTASTSAWQTMPGGRQCLRLQRRDQLLIRASFMISL